MDVEWSDTAKRHYFQIIDYINDNWGANAVATFRKKVRKAVESIQTSPNAYPLSNNLNARKCVVAKHNLIIYRPLDEVIHVLDFVNSRTDHPY